MDIFAALIMSKYHAMRRLPSLRAICAHESAARLGSFTKAAQELNVTQGAVSRQIKELERHLATELFVRSGPRLRLTEKGRELAASAGRALDVLRDAVTVAQGRREAGYVTLSMLPSVATKWLAPRLGRFVNQHPDIDLRVSASRNLVNFEAEEIDAAIRYGKGNWSGLRAELLGGETVFPVCTPAYAEDLGLITPDRLTRATLLHADIEEDWATWFGTAGFAKDRVPQGPRLGDAAAIMQAAIDGQGVALGRSRLVADDLVSGRLIAPFEIELPASFSYWFVRPEGSVESQNLIVVFEWIRSEFGATEQPQA